MDENFLSLRRTLPSVLWSGIQLRPEVDLELHLKPFSGGTFLIVVRLVGPKGAAYFVTGGLFTRAGLEEDIDEPYALVNHLESVQASMEADGGVLLSITILGGEQLFKLYAMKNGPNVEPVDRWDWFVDPSLPVSDELPIYLARPINQGIRLAT